MMRSLLKQSWQAQVRSPLWERSLAINLLLGFFVLYLLGSFLLAGYFMDSLLEATVPDEDPLAVFSKLLFYTWCGGLLLRFLLQQFPLMDIQAYLLLPIRRSQLFHHLLLRSVFDVFNLIPLVFALPFAFKAILPVHGILAGLAWLSGLMSLVLFNHFAAFYAKRQFNLSPLAVFGAFLALSGLVFLDYRGPISLSDYFGRGMMALLDWPALALVYFAAVSLAYFWLYRALYRNAYLDTLSERQAQVKSSEGIAALRRLGAAGQFLQLELQQIWRNKRPRAMLIVAILILFYPFFALDHLNQGNPVFAFFFTLMSMAFPMASYGQFLIAWESSFFSMLMSRKIALPDYMQSKYYLFVLMNIVTCCLCLLYCFADLRMLPIVLACFSVNLSLGAYTVLWLSAYNTRPINPDKNAFMNWEGIGASQFLVTLPTFVVPALIYFGFESLFGWLWGLAAIGGLSLIVLLFHRPVMRAVARHLASRKHTLLHHFKSDT